MKAIVILIGAVLMWFAVPMGTTNAYLESKVYDSITVRQGDSLWSIAACYVSDQNDIREMIIAVRKVNQLDRNARIYPGQTLRIPATEK